MAPSADRARRRCRCPSWQERRLRRQDLRGTGNRLATFDDANLRRTADAAGATAARVSRAHAAGATAARVSRALHILGDSAPDHLEAAGALRLHYRHATLGELGRLADPPLSKDAVAGRIHRLEALADRVAGELGIPDTASAIASDLRGEP